MADVKWYMRQIDRSWIRVLGVIVIPIVVLLVVANQWKGWSEPVSCPNRQAVLLSVEVGKQSTNRAMTVTRTLSTGCDWHSSKALADAVSALTQDLDGATTTTTSSAPVTSTTAAPPITAGD